MLVLGASSGLVSWVLLCWYVGGGKKREFVLDIIPLSIAVAVFVPFVLLYQGAIWLVQGCQKWFCGVTFEEERDNVVAEEVVVDMEMQRLIKGDDDDDDEETGVRDGVSIMSHDSPRSNKTL